MFMKTITLNITSESVSCTVPTIKKSHKTGEDECHVGGESR